MPETIGQRLKKAREDRYLSLEKASEDTRIRGVFLQALESDDYSIMPSAAQGRGFLRNYAEYLGLDMDAMIAEIQRSAPPPEEVVGPLPEVNLVETEVPPLVDADDEPAPRFWTRWSARRARTESPPELVQDSHEAVEPAPPPPEPAEVETPKPRKGRKKKAEEQPPQPADVTEIQPEAEIPPGEEEQACPEQDRRVEVRAEAAQGLFARLASLFRFEVKKQEIESPSDMEEEVEEKVEAPPQPALPADVIFAEIGAQLRERRELISLTIEEVERHTKLRAVFVKALEEGSFEKLPSPVQTRGMISNYATFLDMDVDTVLLRFADALQARRREKYAETPREKIQTEVNASIPFLRTYLAGDLVFGLVMIGVLVALAIWGVGHVIRLQEEPEATPGIVFPETILSPTPTPEAAFDLDAPTPTFGIEPLVSPDAPTPFTNANVTVSIFALERVFVRISVDGEVAFEGRMAPREVKVFEADDQIVVLTGNGSALRITYNGRDLGLMGGVGEVVSRVYLESGVATPTATIPPTPTNTPLVTPTFTPTLTPTATPLTDP
jgi:cytoskeleton protein RodZ